jgi:hypothetical protein
MANGKRQRLVQPTPVVVVAADIGAVLTTAPTP